MNIHLEFSIFAPKMKFSFTLILVFLGFEFNSVTAQNYAEEKKDDSARFVIGGYLDVYYGFDFNKPADKNRPYFVSSSRHNEVAINLAILDIIYTAPRVRFALKPAFGTFMQNNFASEPILLRNLYEANVGFRPFKKKEIWIDAGNFYSPYTNESAISKDHLTYTRSMSAENVPYYLSGIRASIELNKKWHTYLYMLNGWQVIQSQGKHKALGTQLEYKASKKLLLNWNTFIGNVSTDSSPNMRMRYFTDVFALWNMDGKFSVTACALGGLQNRLDTAARSYQSNWYSANVQARYRITKQHSISAKAEFFKDKQSVLVTPITQVKGFDYRSITATWNISIVENMMLRFEAKTMFSPDKIFKTPNGTPTNHSNLVISSLTVWF